MSGADRSTKGSGSVLSWALAWAARGVPIFPIGDGKSPVSPHAFYNATTKPNAIHGWARDGIKQFGAAAGHGVLWIDIDADDAKRKTEKKAPHHWGEVSRDDVLSGAPVGADPDTGDGHHAFAAGPELGVEPPRTRPHRKDPDFLLYEYPKGTVTIGASLAGSNCVDWRFWGGYVRLKGPPPEGDLPPLPPRLKRQLLRAKGLNDRVKRHTKRAAKIRTVEDAIRHLNETARDGRHPALGRVVMPLVRLRKAGSEFAAAHPTVTAVVAAFKALVGDERDAEAEVHRDFESAFEEVAGQFADDTKRRRKKTKLDFGEVTEDLEGDTLTERLARHGWEVRYNIRWMQDQARQGGGKWTALTDRIESHLRVILGAMDWEDRVWRALMLNTLYNNEVDPVLLWLESLPEWDGTPRIDHWAERAWRIRPGFSDLAKWMGIHVFLGSVKRTLEPGAKLDVTPVIEGKQGIGKSWHLEHVLPPDMRDAFGDELNLGGSQKIMLEAIQGKMLIEIAEMHGISAAKLDALKVFLTRTVDAGIRLAYRKNPEVSYRRCVAVGTVNNDGTGILPNDSTGNRRWAVVSVIARLATPHQLMGDGEREQYWAEALHRVRAGEDPSFPAELEQRQEHVNELFRMADPIEALLDDKEHIVHAMVKDGSPGITLISMIILIGMTGVAKRDADTGEAIAKKAPAEVTKGEMMRLSRALKARGWVKYRVEKDGHRAWYWRPPVDSV